MPPKLDQHAGNLVDQSAQLQQDLRTHILAQPADKFAGKPWDLIREIEDFATEKGLRMIYRSDKITTSKDALATMDPKPKVVVEFGTFVGTSAIAWAAMLQEFHGKDAEDIKVFTFEFSPEAAAVARDLIKAAALDNIIEVLVGAGADSLKKLHAEGRVKPGHVDVVFIDHWEKHYLPDLKLVEELKLFHVGSLALADNTDMPGAPDYLAYVKKGGEGSVKYESQSLQSVSTSGRPNIVECSKVVAI
ncbi:hypothetical protein N0V82_006940 [Gnomoniopsis sp. IMI 355080]|nr:hypothetical protein N0V82_006940 [Gnomoniopsis sp. IMI 355080]